MYNIIIATCIGSFVLLLTRYTLNIPWWGAMLLSTLVMFGVMFFLIKYTMKKVMESIDLAGKDLQNKRFEKAIRDLKSTEEKYSKWQMFVSDQINSQIGMIYYLKRDFKDAFPYLQKAFFKNWVALAMLAITYMKRHKKDMMIKTFEKAVKWSPKEPLLWSLYAYCMLESDETNKAKEILESALKKCPGDENLKDNLSNIKSGKKMKMRQYGDMWFQFHLESVGAIQKHHMSKMGHKKIIRK